MSDICLAEVADLSVNFEKALVTRENEVIELPSLSYKLFTALIESYPESVSYAELIEKVWNGVQISEENLKQRMSMLRRSLAAQSNLDYIKTVRGKGYRLCCSVSIQHSKHNVIKPKHTLSFKLKRPFWIMLPLALSMTALLSSSFDLLKRISIQETPPSVDKVPRTHPILKIKESASIELENGNDFGIFLDGHDDYLEVDNDKALDIQTGDFSMETWVKTLATDLHVIIDKRYERLEGNVKGYNLFIYKGYLGSQLADGNGKWDCQSDNSSCTNYLSKAFIADGNLHHILVSVDRDQKLGLKYFVDGVLVSQFNPTERQGSLSNNSVFRIGSRSSFKTGLFPGEIYGVNIYRYALSEDEVNRRYNLNSPKFEKKEKLVVVSQ